MMFHKDEQIMNYLTKDASVVPIWTIPKEAFDRLPYGFNAFRGLHVSDVERYLKSKLVSEEHRLKKQRLYERQQEQKGNWIQKETQKRALPRIDGDCLNMNGLNLSEQSEANTRQNNHRSSVADFSLSGPACNYWSIPSSHGDSNTGSPGQSVSPASRISRRRCDTL